MTRTELQSGFVGLSWLACGALGGFRWGWVAALGIAPVAGLAGMISALILLTLSDDLDLRLIRLSQRRPGLGLALRVAETVFTLMVLAALMILPLVLVVHLRGLETDQARPT